MEEEFSRLCVDRLKKVHNIESFKRAQENHLYTLGKAMAPNYSPKVVAEKKMMYSPSNKNSQIRSMFGNGNSQ